MKRKLTDVEAVARAISKMECIWVNDYDLKAKAAIACLKKRGWRSQNQFEHVAQNMRSQVLEVKDLIAAVNEPCYCARMGASYSGAKVHHGYCHILKAINKFKEGGGGGDEEDIDSVHPRR